LQYLSALGNGLFFLSPLVFIGYLWMFLEGVVAERVGFEPHVLVDPLNLPDPAAFEPNVSRDRSALFLLDF
jgi:hypothetical protein